MGWTPGSGLGKYSPEPIPAQAGQTDRAGLGITSRRRGGRKPPREDKFVGVWTPKEIIYGTCEGQYLSVYKLDIKGRPMKTKELILVTQDQL